MPDPHPGIRIPLTVSQQNIYRGILQDADPTLYLIGRRYRFSPIPLPQFLVALEAAINGNPVQLCVLEQSDTSYPHLVPRLQPDDLVRLTGQDTETLAGEWDSGILSRPLVRYAVHVDSSGDVVGLDMHAHHLVLDGGGTGLIEASLGNNLSVESVPAPDVAAGLNLLAEAQRRETELVAVAHDRLTSSVQRELTAEVSPGGLPPSSVASASARRGVLRESLQITGDDYVAITDLAAKKQVPLQVLVTAAAVAVDAARRQSTDALVVHAVDNRFGEPALNVATCVVNSIAQLVKFSAFTSVHELVAAVDRGYVKALRRRWFREELYRRIYLTVNRTPQTDVLTLNFLAEPCAPELRPFLSDTPTTTDIGPIEGLTVAAIQDDPHQILTLAIWVGEQHQSESNGPGVAELVAKTLQSMPALWDQPVAMSVGEWLEVQKDGSCHAVRSAPCSVKPSAAAWFLHPGVDLDGWRRGRRYVDAWIDWLVSSGVSPGELVVFTDDHTDKTIDLIVACHVAGCGYSICDTVTELSDRVAAIASAGLSAQSVDVGGVDLSPHPADHRERLRRVRDDAGLADRIAYVMPTSGSTGNPKLVPISHGALALFCQGQRSGYGWTHADTVLQCAPLTSDISVEEIFGAAQCGAHLIRSTATRTGDLAQLADDVARQRITVLDLPTALWHLCCDDSEVLAALSASQLRQIVIGGEAVRPRAAGKWLAFEAASHISLVSSYGPTEATVVVTYLPLNHENGVAQPVGQRRLGHALAAQTVFIAFGEIVLLGDVVSTGYLGISSPSFGTVLGADGSQLRAFATADRVVYDAQSLPIFAGRKDAVVKVSGKRIDTAEIARLIAEDPAVSDVAVEPDNTRLGIWFQSRRTREGSTDDAAEARIREILLTARVPGFVISGVAEIPRKPGGKVDIHRLPKVEHTRLGEAEGQAGGLAELWSQCLGRDLGPGSSLLAEGIGSLDLIRILPATRRYLRRHLSLLDVISADSASRLVEDADGIGVGLGLDETSAAEIDADVSSLAAPLPIPSLVATPRATGTVLVLGSSGILGTGFAQAAVTLHASGSAAELVFATTSPLPGTDPWSALSEIDGVRIEQVTRNGISELIHATDARVVINAIGNTNVVVPYRDLRPANVEAVSSIVTACALRRAALIHLSTSVVNADAAAPQVVDPRTAPYPYAASKALAELIVARRAPNLDFTLVRLPRVLGTPGQLQGSADILMALAAACRALNAHPAVSLTEEVTTGWSAASSIFGLLSAPLNRSITLLRGTPVEYSEFLARFGSAELSAPEWKQRLDDSPWARHNPRRWAVIDAWLTLGSRLDGRTYAQYLADYPTLEVQADHITELTAEPAPLPELVAHGCLLEPGGSAVRLLTQEAMEERP
ncbi:hypothetical protein BST33_11155 [Mycolicibacter minnesotensis]|uniref:Uncharacterized protein n=1 Tax=Mycolicibacter minnesotensis TaxID=1118379 RepID=A0A7I7R3P8_9MYCO|nr:AMP-binding protein [Mycolicibacter minnesotensis]ORB00528.1 hypothetical protein BST33_11155 [Mycolicibacter minnesotensis]BBY33248.1 peptide synthase [Mycolicibacter minnesotensis]